MNRVEWTEYKIMVLKFMIIIKVTDYLKITVIILKIFLSAISSIRKSRLQMFFKIGVLNLKFLQISQENTSVGVSF